MICPIINFGEKYKQRTTLQFLTAVCYWFYTTWLFLTLSLFLPFKNTAYPVRYDIILDRKAPGVLSFITHDGLSLHYFRYAKLMSLLKSNKYVRPLLSLFMHLWYIYQLFAWTKANIFYSNRSRIFGNQPIMSIHTTTEIVIGTQCLCLRHIGSTLYFLFPLWNVMKWSYCIIILSKNDTFINCFTMRIVSFVSSL